MTYKHTQVGWLILAFCAAVLAFVAALSKTLPLQHARPIPLWTVVAVLLTVALLFASLTVEVDDEFIYVRFGPGLMRGRFRLVDIAECKPVRNRWWMGWGIHGWPGPRGGWLFNVSGFDAVELRMKNGRIYRIGTDEPQKLAAVIQAKLGKVI